MLLHLRLLNNIEKLTLKQILCASFETLIYILQIQSTIMQYEKFNHMTTEQLTFMLSTRINQ